MKWAYNSPTVDETTTRSPVELEDTARVRDRGAIQSQGFGSSIRGRELHKAVASVAKKATEVAYC